MSTTPPDRAGSGGRRGGQAGEVIPPPPGGALTVGGLTALTHSVHLIAQATDVLRHKLSHHLNLNPIDVTALINIYNSPDIRPTDLGRSLHMGSGGLTALADRLVKAGFVDRKPDPTDRRGYGLRLSPAGLQAAAWIFDTVANALATHLDRSGDRQAMTSTLIELSRAIEQVEPTGPDLPAAL